MLALIIDGVSIHNIRLKTHYSKNLIRISRRKLGVSVVYKIDYNRMTKLKEVLEREVKLL